MHQSPGLKVQQGGRAEPPQTTKLHVGRLTRNVTEAHLREIFGTFGPLKLVDLVLDKTVNLSRGYAYVEYETVEDAEKAQVHMDEGQLDGNVLT